jgi:hypothetical protein
MTMPRPPITLARPWTPSSGAFAGQTFHTERAYRDALARHKGFTSWRTQQTAPGPEIRGRRDLRRLRPAEQAAYEKTGMVLTLMRREGLSLDEASRRVHTTPNAVRRHGADALVRTSRGRYAVTAADAHFRRMWFITPDGLTTVETRDSRAASLVAEFDAAVQHYLATGDDRRLDRFRGKVLRAGGKRYPFVTDLDILDELGRRGEISFETIYASAA